MAFTIINFSKASSIIRSARYLAEVQKVIQFSTSQVPVKEQNTAPVKYTTNKAAKVPIAEAIGLEKKSTRLWFEKYVIMASFFAFIVYFGIFREENDIDEILRGNSEYFDPRVELIKLKTQLKYCEKNNLPTGQLRAKIQEIEDKLAGPHTSPFRM